MGRIVCAVFGHRWVEQLPHRMWSLNDYHCARCGAHTRRGIYTWTRA